MKRHALFVGVDQYADGHIPNLTCAVSDATDLHGFFKYGAGYDQVELLPNPSSKKEVLGKVRNLTAGLGPGDFFLFFFAGHGFRVGENHVLVCSNDLYDDVKYEYDGLPLGQLKHRLSSAFNSALLLDACQSDILATRGGEGIAERDISLIHEAPTGGSGGGALTIVTSCDAGQTAAELSERRHGLFTVAMLDLLKEAQRTHARLDLSDAFRLSLGQRMGEIAARFGLPTEQRPRFSCTGNSCFVLLDGVASTPDVQIALPQPTPSPVSPVMAPVACPECGMYNVITNTFKCKVCGRDHLCREHYSKDEKCCADCAAKVQARRAADEKARREVEEKARLEVLPKTSDVEKLVQPVGVEGERKKIQLWEGGPYWAETNIGAQQPWEFGYYFWWGDTVGSKRVNDTWVASDGSSIRAEFYITLTYGKGFSALRKKRWTNGSSLAPEHDAAQVQWGGGWRMPTDQELRNLVDKCDWTWATVNGVNGSLVRGRGSYASASIFLPAAGFGRGDSLNKAGSYGYYWSSVPTSNHGCSGSLYFNSSRHVTDADVCRSDGFSVRPVI